MIKSYKFYTVIFIFIFFISIYTLFAKPDFLTYDEISYFYTGKNISQTFSFSMYQNCMAAASKAVNGKYYSRYGIGFPIILSPFIWLGNSLSDIYNIKIMEHTVAIFANITITSILMVVLFLIFIELNLSNKNAFLLVLVCGTGTLIFYYSSTLLGEPLTSLCMLSSIFMILKLLNNKKSVSTIFFLNLFIFFAVLTRPNIILITVWFSLFLVLNKYYKFALYTFLTNLSASVFWCCYNWYRFRNIFDFGYNQYDINGTPLKLKFPLIKGIFYNLFSLDRSFIFYSIPLILLVFTIIKMWKKQKQITILTSITFLIQLLFYSKWMVWEGGNTFGSRFILPVIPILFILLAPLPDFYKNKNLIFKTFLVFIILTGISCQLIFSSINYQGITYLYQKVTKKIYVIELRKNPFSIENYYFNKQIFNLGIHNIVKYFYYNFKEPKLIKHYHNKSTASIPYTKLVREPNYIPIFYYMIDKINWQQYRNYCITFLLISVSSIILLLKKIL